MNTATGTLLDHNITYPLNIHVQWMHMEDIQVKIASFIFLTVSFVLNAFKKHIKWVKKYLGNTVQ